jgi:hypothetical protein
MPTSGFLREFGQHLVESTVRRGQVIAHHQDQVTHCSQPADTQLIRFSDRTVR